MLEATLRRGTLLAVIVLIVVVLGVLAATRVPVQMIPDLEVRTVTVQTRWPGATPQDIEQEILIEQEEYLRGIPNLQRLVATANTSEASIELEFPFGVDVGDALLRVSNALSQVTGYPENVDEPRLFTNSFSDNSFMFFVVTALPGNPQGLEMSKMRDFVDDVVRPRFERVPNVSEASVRDGAERQVQILVDPARLAERGLTLTAVREAVRGRNRDVSGGDLDSGKRRYLLRTIGRYADLPALDATVIAERNGALVRLEDVATTRLDYSESRSLSFLSGQPGINIGIKRQPGSNVIEIKRAAMLVMDEVNRDLLAPLGMQITLISDDVRYVEASIANVVQNLLIGAVLATLVMYLFLRSLPATLVVVVCVPICIIVALMSLVITGRTINVISLAGIAFAIGMTLDNSIVVLESIERAGRQGLDRMTAALRGVRLVWPAVLASTLTTVLVFAPVLLLREEAGQLYSDVAIAISAAILASMLVAITVVPAACSRWLARGANGSLPTAAGPFRARLDRALESSIATRPRRLGILGGILLGAAATALWLTPPAEYLPEGEEPKIFSLMLAPPGYNLTEMLEVADQVHEQFLPYLGDDPGRFARGETPVPALAYWNMSVAPKQIRVIAETRDPRQIDALGDVVSRRFAAFPGMRSFSSRGSIISSNDGGTRSINIDVSGSDLPALYRTAAAIADRARTELDGPQVRSEPSSLVLGQPLIEVRPRWDRLAELGINAAEFGYGVAALTDGAFVDEFLLANEKLDIYLYSRPESAPGVGGIGQLPLSTPRGAVVPVSAVADLVQTVDTDTLRRVDGRRTVTVYVIPPRQVALESGVALVRERVIGALRAEGQVPPGVTVRLSGASDQLDATRAALAGNLLVALLICYLLLVAIFTHWGVPLLIMVTVPVGIAGGLLGLAALNGVGALLPLAGLPALAQPFDMITMLGFLILVGTVVNNPILVVDQALKNLKDGSVNVLDAVNAAVRTRLRPVMMTTLTTAFGLAPLVFLPGAGTELYRGVGVIVLGGLVCSTLVTLTFLPALLVTVLEWKNRPRARA
ncbi:MAG: efflux RND transporter permease subunit [Chromatiales bacterium]|nr:efflux RND transporter permease subunit [Chromatiales bacterium]